MFIAEIQEHYQLPVIAISLNAETVSEFSVLNFTKGLSPEIEKLEDDLQNKSAPLGFFLG